MSLPVDKLMKELLKEAHDHGYATAKSKLDWSIEKSYTEFLKQNNIPLITEDELRDEVGYKAIQLRAQGYTLRAIASLLGYEHPQSIKNIILWYEKRQAKRNKNQQNNP